MRWTWPKESRITIAVSAATFAVVTPETAAVPILVVAARCSGPMIEPGKRWCRPFRCNPGRMGERGVARASRRHMISESATRE